MPWLTPPALMIVFGLGLFWTGVWMIVDAGRAIRKRRKLSELGDTFD